MIIRTSTKGKCGIQQRLMGTVPSNEEIDTSQAKSYALVPKIKFSLSLTHRAKTTTSIVLESITDGFVS